MLNRQFQMSHNARNPSEEFLFRQNAFGDIALFTACANVSESVAERVVNSIDSIPVVIPVRTLYCTVFCCGRRSAIFTMSVCESTKFLFCQQKFVPTFTSTFLIKVKELVERRFAFRQGILASRFRNCFSKETPTASRMTARQLTKIDNALCTAVAQATPEAVAVFVGSFACVFCDDQATVTSANKVNKWASHIVSRILRLIPHYTTYPLYFEGETP